MQDQNTTHAVAAVQPRAVGGLTDYALSASECLRQATLIQQVMREVMHDGSHYGVVPGTQGKKSLLKPGAEKLCFVFGLSNKLDIRITDLGNGHREITVICDLYDRAGNLRGQGVGSASTMESKHRYRGAAGKVCPICGAQSCKPGKKEYGGGYYCDSKAGGCNARFKGGSAESKALDSLPSLRAENPDPADQYNTVLKMAKKRALVDAVLTATAASDIFDQDLDDLEERAERVAESEAAHVPPVASSTPEPEPPPRKAAPTKPAAHPAIEAARALFRTCERTQAGSGKPIIDDLCRLYGVDAPGEVPADKLDSMGALIARLADLAEDPPALMDEIGRMLLEQAGQEGG